MRDGGGGGMGVGWGEGCNLNVNISELFCLSGLSEGWGGGGIKELE